MRWRKLISDIIYGVLQYKEDGNRPVFVLLTYFPYKAGTLRQSEFHRETLKTQHAGCQVITYTINNKTSKIPAAAKISLFHLLFDAK